MHKKCFRNISVSLFSSICKVI